MRAATHARRLLGSPPRRRARAGARGPQAGAARRYFPQQFDPSEEHLLLKEMRFRVRHIVVCLLLQRRDEARELLGVLTELVGIYAANLQARSPRCPRASWRRVSTSAHAAGCLCLVQAPPAALLKAPASPACRVRQLADWRVRGIPPGAAGAAGAPARPAALAGAAPGRACGVRAQAADVREWQLVCEEVGRFIAADEPAHRPDAPQRTLAALSLRCQPASPLASIPFTLPFLRLQARPRARPALVPPPGVPGQRRAATRHAQPCQATRPCTEGRVRRVCVHPASLRASPQVGVGFGQRVNVVLNEQGARLQEAVLACYYAGQVKVAELPLDTCRMMQALEWEDPAASAPAPGPLPSRGPARPGRP